MKTKPLGEAVDVEIGAAPKLLALEAGDSFPVTLTTPTGVKVSTSMTAGHRGVYQFSATMDIAKDKSGATIDVRITPEN